MRLDAAHDPDELYEWLKVRSLEAWGEERTALLDPRLRSLAEAMVAVARADVPDDVEPRFP